MDLGIKDKVALVTGAGGGLGGAIAEALAAEGARVILADRDLESADNKAKEIIKNSGKAVSLRLELGDLKQVEEQVFEIKEKFGGVDVLINNTGGPKPTLAQGVSPIEWENYFRQMVVSVIHLTDLLLPGMQEKKWGRIITSTSSGVITPIPNLGISNALRMSLVGWNKTLSQEVARDGVTANVILPGRIATNRIQALDEAKAQREGVSMEEVQKMSTSSIPLRRYGRPDEYGSVVAFLASERASYMNGSVVRVDGGLISSI